MHPAGISRVTDASELMASLSVTRTQGWKGRTRVVVHLYASVPDCGRSAVALPVPLILRDAAAPVSWLALASSSTASGG